jgi:hypothetical protein
MELSTETFQLILDKIDSLEKSMSDKIDALLFGHENPINIYSRV